MLQRVAEEGNVNVIGDEIRIRRRHARRGSSSRTQGERDGLSQPPCALALTLLHHHREPPLRRGNPGATKAVQAALGCRVVTAARNDIRVRAKGGW